MSQFGKFFQALLEHRMLDEAQVCAVWESVAA
jgi:hypothetical protein